MDRKTPRIELTLTTEYKIAVADVISQWAFFETEFDWILAVLIKDQKAKHLASEVPFSFKKRRKLFRDAAKACFEDCPALAKRLLTICTKAKALKLSRDRLAHCRWLGDPEDGVMTIAIHTNDHIDIYTVGCDYLAATATKISAISVELLTLMRVGPVWKGEAFSFAQDEIDALQAFWRRNRPPGTTPALTARPLLEPPH